MSKWCRWNGKQWKPWSDWARPCHLRTTKVQRSFEILASSCSWAGYFESYLVENPWRHSFAWCGLWVYTVCPGLSVRKTLDHFGNEPRLAVPFKCQESGCCVNCSILFERDRKVYLYLLAHRSRRLTRCAYSIVRLCHQSSSSTLSNSYVSQDQLANFISSIFGVGKRLH